MLNRSASLAMSTSVLKALLSVGTMSGYFGSATPHTVYTDFFRNFADVLFIVSGCACVVRDSIVMFSHLCSLLTLSLFVRLHMVAFAFAGRVIHVVLGLISFKLVELNPPVGEGGGAGYSDIFTHT